ncbi:MAG: TMAO reductase system protein TorT [Sphaerochaetaceae bacterium]
MKKRVVGIALILVLLLSLVGQNVFAGGKAEAPKKDGYTFGFAMPMLTNSYWIPLLYGIRSECEKLGINLIEVEAGGFGNLDKQISQIENLMQQGVDALLVGATDGAGVVAIVEQAMDMGIPVVGVGSQPKTDKMTTKVLADDYDMGVIQAEALAEILNGKGEVAMFSGPPGNNWSEDRADGFRDTVAAKYPGLKIVAEQWTEVSRTIAIDLMETWIQAFPNLQGIYSANDDLAAAAVTAIVGANKQNQIKVASANPTDAGFENLKNNLMAAFAIQQTVLQGQEGVRAALKAVKGEPTEKVVVTSALKLTAENFATFDFSSVRHPDWFKP